MKKRTKVVVISVSAAVVSAAAFALCYLKRDAVYVMYDRLSAIAESAELAEVVPEDTCVWTVGEELPAELSGSEVVVDQSMMLINADHPIGADFAADTVEYKDSGVIMNRCVTDAYASLSAAVAEETGEKLYIMSAFRTAEEQASAIEEEGENAAGIGESEHMAGLGLDVYVKYYDGAGFLKSESGRFVNSRCGDYGFIIRYPYYGEDKTEIGYEPWHIRYVGQPHAEIISKERITLEEYLDMLEAGRFYAYGDYVISRQEGVTLELPAGYGRYVISPDNLGGYVVTAER